jgi:outer membrane protein OmpA-like peptidoglycan-associated protein
VRPALPSPLAKAHRGRVTWALWDDPKRAAAQRRAWAAPQPPPMASPPKQRRFFQRPVNANAPQDYTPFAAPPPPPGSARRSSGRRVTDFLPNATPTNTDSAFSPRRALDFLPTSAPPPIPPPSPLEAENAELRRRLAEAERSAVQDERLLRQRASEDAEALQNEVKELRRRCSLTDEERRQARDEAERLSKELTERGEATLQEVATLNTKLAQAERKVKVRTENEDDDPLRPGFHRRASERIKEVYLSAMNEHFERVASGVVALRKSSEREAAEESVEGYASLVRKALRERSAADANLKDGLEALSPSPTLSPRFDDFASPTSAARVSKPTLTNVSTDPREVEVEITVTTPDATVEYCVSHVNAAGSPRSITIPAENRWTRADEPGAVRLPRLAAGGRHVVICRATAPGRPTSKVASEAFDLLPPNLVQHSRHPHELRVLRQPGGPCEICGKSDDARPGYGCPECPDFILCAKCALPPGFSPDIEQDEKDCVAVDVGAKRVWLSRRIEFKGNYTRILDGSFGVLDQLALTLKQHSGIRLRLEGHVNSKCGLGCDGSTECSNNRCAALFRGRGGSVGFSLGRADAVAEALHERGIEAYRLECRGLGGSRVVEDTEGDLKHRNRRVEVHTVAWS